jgi:hypothetical protein
VTGTWVVVVSADRDFYDRNGVAEVQFPLGTPDRTIELAGDRMSIGRRSRSLGTAPAIDLAEPPEDGGISHTHASLLRQADGSWALADHGSSNGTYLNDATDPLPAETPVGLRSGDRFYLGAWTRVVIEHLPAP